MLRQLKSFWWLTLIIVFAVWSRIKRLTSLIYKPLKTRAKKSAVKNTFIYCAPITLIWFPASLNFINFFASWSVKVSTLLAYTASAFKSSIISYPKNSNNSSWFLKHLSLHSWFLFPLHFYTHSTHRNNQFYIYNTNFFYSTSENFSYIL